MKNSEEMKKKILEGIAAQDEARILDEFFAGIAKMMKEKTCPEGDNEYYCTFSVKRGFIIDILVLVNGETEKSYLFPIEWLDDDNWIEKI